MVELVRAGLATADRGARKFKDEYEKALVRRKAM